MVVPLIWRTIAWDFAGVRELSDCAGHRLSSPVQRCGCLQDTKMAALVRLSILGDVVRLENPVTPFAVHEDLVLPRCYAGHWGDDAVILVMSESVLVDLVP